MIVGESVRSFQVVRWDLNRAPLIFMGRYGASAVGAEPFHTCVDSFVSEEIETRTRRSVTKFIFPPSGWWTFHDGLRSYL